MRLCFLLLGTYILSLICFCGYSQQISGRVVDSSTSRPVAGASVYINSTSIGGVTNENGDFAISSNLAAARCELVISSVGYHTRILALMLDSENNVSVNLSPRIETLDEVVIRNYETNGWRKWGFLFRSKFIGGNKFSENCRIKNGRDILFSYSSRSNSVRAVATKPIVVINNALGYILEYDLINFYFHHDSSLIIYSGYPKFTEMKGGKGKELRWKRNREEAYRGSLLHFLRSVHDSTLESSGFQVKRLVRQPNKEKNRIRNITKHQPSDHPADSLSYYNKVLRQSDYLDFLIKDPLPFNQFATRSDSLTTMLLFNDYLHITYIPNRPLKENGLQHGAIGKDRDISSVLKLSESRPVMVSKSGSFHEPLGLLVSDGYWTWSETIATLLPYNYQL